MYFHGPESNLPHPDLKSVVAFGKTEDQGDQCD